MLVNVQLNSSGSVTTNRPFESATLFRPDDNLPLPVRLITDLV